MPDRGVPPVRVLYVDDDIALVRLVQKSLGRRGYEVVHATDGHEAFARARSEDFDRHRPRPLSGDGNGTRDPRPSFGRRTAPPIVYVTGSSEMNVAVAALTRGAADFVPKTVGDDFVTLLAYGPRASRGKSAPETQKESAEREVSAARDRAEILLAEVNHRVANSLSVVSSLVGLQEKNAKDEAARIALGGTKARIYAIALVHKSLYTSGMYVLSRSTSIFEVWLVTSKPRCAIKVMVQALRPTLIPYG